MSKYIPGKQAAAGMAHENQRMVQEAGLVMTVTHSVKEMERVAGFQREVESAKPITQQPSPESSLYPYALAHN